MRSHLAVDTEPAGFRTGEVTPVGCLPHSVNNIALQSLIAAFADEKSIVDESSTRLAITETHATE